MEKFKLGDEIFVKATVTELREGTIAVKMPCAIAFDNGGDLQLLRHTDDWNTRPEIDNWISVKDRLPEKYGYVLAVCAEHLPFIAMFKEYYIRADFTKGCFFVEEEIVDPTHWQPLPKPPSKKKLEG